MKCLLSSGVVAVCTLILAASAEQIPTSTAITHVSIVDVRTGNVSTDRTVVVRGDEISDIGPSRSVLAPRGSRTINGKRKYLIPGLWDMHVHTLWDANRPPIFFPLFLANGVTGVREMGGPMPATDQVRWRNDVQKGIVVGPRLLVSGPFVDGPRAVWPGSIEVSSQEDGQQAVRALKAARVDFVKVYTNVPRPAYFGLAQEAKAEGIAFVGHVPVDIGVDEASVAGQQSVEHLMGVLLYTSSKSEELKAKLMSGTNVNALNDQLVDTYDPSRASHLFALFSENNTWQTPTLTIRHARPYLQELQALNDPRLKYLPQSIVQSWGPGVDRRQPTDPGVIASRKRLFAKELQLVAAMQKAGVRILAGTDTPNPYCYPGFSLHDELAFLVQAGLTPLEALQTATINPARFFGITGRYGTVEKGKAADLLLLNANPLEDIANTRQIDVVVAAGHFYDTSARQQLLQGAAQRAAIPGKSKDLTQ